MSETAAQPAAREGEMIEQVAALLMGQEAPPPPEEPKVETPAVPDTDDTDSTVLDGIAAALSGVETPPVDKPGSTVERPKVDLEINAIAEHLGVDTAELYEKLLVPMPEGAEPLTIGALKDREADRVQHSLEVESFNSERDAHRVEMGKARAELEQVIRLIPPEYRTPEMLQSAQAELGRTKQREQVALLDRIPEWRDEVRRNADLEVIGPHIEKFGFPRAMLSDVVDHRLFAYVRHNALREQRLEKLLADAKGKRERQGGRGPGKRRPPAAKAAPQPIPAGALRADVAGAVGDILINSAKEAQS